MIEFFQNLKQDLLDYPLVTEFVVIHKGIPGFTPDNCFIYVSKKFRDYKIHENLLLKVRMLEDNNFVIDISTGDIPHFKMTPEFKDLVITEDS